MKTITVVLICLLSCFSPNKLIGQDDKKGVLNITIYESNDKAYNKILVYENLQKLEQIDLSRFYYDDLDSHILEINKVLLKYKNSGYKIISSVRGSANLPNHASVMTTTYLLEK